MLKADGAADEELYSEAHTFLSEQGNINFGILKGEPQPGKHVTKSPTECAIDGKFMCFGLANWVHYGAARVQEHQL